MNGVRVDDWTADWAIIAINRPHFKVRGLQKGILHFGLAPVCDQVSSWRKRLQYLVLHQYATALLGHLQPQDCIYGSSMVLHLLHGLPNKYRRDDCANYQLDNFVQTKIKQATSKVLLNGTEKELIHGRNLYLTVEQ